MLTDKMRAAHSSDSPDHPPLIALRDVSFRYPGAASPTLNAINFSLHKQRRVGLVGPNGSGKTSLIHVIMGLESSVCC